MLVNSNHIQYTLPVYRPDYGYQTPLIERTYHSLTHKYKTILAACPGAGKTVMAIEIAKRYRRQFPKSNILILTHGQLILRDQWDGQLRMRAPELKHIVLGTGNEAIYYKYPKVVVGLPHSKRELLAAMSEIDLLIVDEAHHFYRGEGIQAIINHLKPKHQLLLTGTPSDYINDKSWAIVPITIQELLARGVLTDPVIEIVESKYSITADDYNEVMELAKDTVMSASGTYATMDHLLGKIIRKVTDRNRTNPEAFHWDAQGTRTWAQCLAALKKTMIVCHNQSQARDIYQYFIDRGVNCVLSISDMNIGQAELSYFKNTPACSLFIVVNRGVLGFDYDELTNLIDMSGTLNTNRLFQMLCRIVRINKREPDTRKLFIKIANPRLALMSHFVMSFVVAMSSEKYYLYAKDDRTQLKIPWDKECATLSLSAACRTTERDNDPWPNLPQVSTFGEVRAIENGTSVKTLSYTSFKTAKNRLMNKYERVYTIELCLEAIKLCKSKTEFVRVYNDHYLWMTRNGCVDELDKFFVKKQPYTLEACLAVAKQYSVKYKFREANNGMYKWMVRNGYADQLPFENSNKRWSKKSAWAKARKYRTGRQFRLAHGGAFDYLMRHGEGDKLREFYERYNTQNTWDKAKVLALASEYPNMRQFREDYSGAESHMRTHGYRDEVHKAFRKHTQNEQD